MEWDKYYSVFYDVDFSSVCYEYVFITIGD